MTAELRAWCEAETVRLLPFIKYIAIRSKIPMPLEDLIQEGAIAVWKALPRFDAGRGLKIETFLEPRIWGALRDFSRRHSRLLSGGQRTGRTEEIVSLQAIIAHSETAGRDVRVEHALADDCDQRADIEAEDFWPMALKGCSERERMMLLQYYREDKTHREIAAGLGVSESRISQALSAAMRKLRARGASILEAVA